VRNAGCDTAPQDTPADTLASLLLRASEDADQLVARWLARLAQGDRAESDERE
jgi:hypothetical protein